MIKAKFDQVINYTLKEICFYCQTQALVHLRAAKLNLDEISDVSLLSKKLIRQLILTLDKASERKNMLASIYDHTLSE